jgi:exportin-1
MPKVRGLRTIKKEVLKLIETYVDKAEDMQAVRMQMVPPLLDSVLVDYNGNVPGARDAEVLKAMSTIITKLSVSTIVPRAVQSMVLMSRCSR